MDVTVSATLGILFLVIGSAAVFLMYHLWGYPFDKATRTSAAPPSLMRLHRILGWIYLLIYLVMMYEMVPRLWNYQVEFPPRTVAHLCLGMSIGIVLLVKVSILRFFRHLEEWMPVLGTLLLGFTILLSGLSIPFAFREYALANQSDGGSAYSQENLERLARLLPEAGFPEAAPLDELANPRTLKAGRTVLVRKCVVCHDLKTILVRPRGPAAWYRTVVRMAEKPTFASPISREEQWASAAYLIAISGDLQKSAKKRREAEIEQKKTAKALAATMSGDAPKPEFDEAAAKAAYETTCSACHELADVDAAPPTNSAEVDALIARMIEDNGMEASKDDLTKTRWYMVKKFAKGGS